MKFSVVIPTYNSAATIKATLDSVLHQTVSPHEILALDDGSGDSTVSLLNAYKPRVSVFEQKNQGVAQARNVLCRRAAGDLVAFLDHDDIWHPRYLELQAHLARQHQKAVAFFTGHVDFFGYGNFNWEESACEGIHQGRIFEPLDFLHEYNEHTHCFASMSYCCLRREALQAMGNEPFPAAVSGADDFYLCNRLPLFGSVAYLPAAAVAYRLIKEAQSSDRLKGVRLAVDAFKLLSPEYINPKSKNLHDAFVNAFATKRRAYARMLMGAGRPKEAREELLKTLGGGASLASLMKTSVVLVETFLPGWLQPRWPQRFREL